jgi:hypothetical protein
MPFMRRLVLLLTAATVWSVTHAAAQETRKVESEPKTAIAPEVGSIDYELSMLFVPKIRDTYRARFRFVMGGAKSVVFPTSRCSS